ncbi:MAG: hypothetical protein IJX44_01315 [Bacteroidaceae bacterium]|nr:hypothetical protein [Bacteroidaceae bacterium]
MDLGNQSQSMVASALKKAVDKLVAEGSQGLITDIHLQPIQSVGELLVFDDEDRQLARAEVKEWVDYEAQTFYSEVELQLRSQVVTLKKKGILDKLPLMKPYSFVLVDEERETVADLLLVDDDTMLLSDGLLKGLDKELDEFLKKLLEE